MLDQRVNRGKLWRDKTWREAIDSSLERPWSLWVKWEGDRAWIECEEGFRTELPRSCLPYLRSAQAARAEPVEPFTFELTKAGEQAVIPGCERNLAKPNRTQLDLWG